MPGELNIEHVELVPPTVNTEQRCLCVLLLDNSGSMSGEPIQHLNEGLKVFYEELKKDALAMLRVEIAIITFGPVCLLQDFIPAQHFVPPSLQSAGDTPMGEAILLALKKIKARKEELAKAGISHYRPWAFLISDGAPTDGEQFIHACKKVQEAEAAKQVLFFSVAVANADITTLSQISSKRPALPLKGLQFRELFQWLSASIGCVARSKPEESVSLSPTSGWSEIEA